MNILITSAGRRVNLVRFFKEALMKNDIDGQVIVANNDKYAASVYEADKSYLVPLVTYEGYIDRIIDICKDNDVDVLISLIDPELPVLADNRERFSQLGVKVIISSPETVEICFDKYKTAEFFKKAGVPYIKTYRDKERAIEALENGEIDYPLIVKLAKGSASKGLYKIENKDDLNNSPIEEDEFIVQQFIEGDEYGVDVFINKAGELVSLFAKKKIAMRAGETDKAVSIKDDKLLELVKKLANKLDAYGPLDIDCFKVENGEFLFSEINPRFGGGYPLAYSAGVDFMDMIVKMVNGVDLEKRLEDYEEGVYMFKYNGLQIVDETEIIN